MTALDVVEEGQRDRAVTATLHVSLNRLTVVEQNRYRELAVFGEDVDIPLATLSRYWHHTSDGQFTDTQTRTLCRRLTDLSLLAVYRLDSPGPRARLHDVVRDYLRHQPGTDLPRLHTQLIDAHRNLTNAWGHLPPSETYLWQYLPTHLYAAGLDTELASTVIDPGWLVGKLTHAGPAGLESDLNLARVTRPAEP